MGNSTSFTSALVAASPLGQKALKSVGLIPDSPAPPSNPEAPMIMEQPKQQQQSQQAGVQQRKRQSAGAGRDDTIKTGPKGLGEVQQQNTERKMLLGY